MALHIVHSLGTAEDANLAKKLMAPPALGSVVAISSEGGAPVATYAYDPWGAPLETRMLGGSALDQAAAARQPFRYRGYTIDAEIGFYYLPADTTTRRPRASSRPTRRRLRPAILRASTRTCTAKTTPSARAIRQARS